MEDGFHIKNHAPRLVLGQVSLLDESDSVRQGSHMHFEVHVMGKSHKFLNQRQRPVDF